MSSSPETSPPATPSSVLSVRIVSLDYYMAPPLASLDFSHSPFHGEKVEEVPVIRIYGSTPAGQKTCLHIHRVLPYLYIPCPDELLHNLEGGNSYITGLMSALEKALKTRGPSKRQHVHGCSLVRAKKMYGYHSVEELFMKIYLYYPHEVSRAATLLLGGAVLNRIFQPYESHIPYLLHFLVDYNLYGMGHIHVSDFKFRPPLPDAFLPGLSFNRKAGCSVKSKEKADSDGDAVQNPAIWISSTVPSALVLGVSASGHYAEVNTNLNLISRQSTSMLEADSSVDGILNEKYKMYMSLSQTATEVKMVQSLIAIWEELEHSGLLEEAKPTELVKPPREDVLKSFLCGIKYENALSELHPKEEGSHCNVSAVEETEKLEKCFKSLTHIIGTVTFRETDYSNDTDGDAFRGTQKKNQNATLPCIPSSNQNGQTTSPEMNSQYPVSASISHRPPSQLFENEDQKHADAEALGLLSWLASSQAAEELITDDELINEVLLSPLFPKKSIEVALEAAHLDFDSASQQECQDILDSVEPVTAAEGQKVQTSYPGHVRCDNSASSSDAIPQVDGSSDENVKIPQEHDKSKRSKKRKGSPGYSASKSSSKSASRRRGTELPWGSLPLSIKKRSHEYADNSAESSSGNSISVQKDYNVSYVNQIGKSYNDSTNNESTGTIGEQDLAGCSVRDLMRRKRFFRPEQLESGNSGAMTCINVKDSDMVTSKELEFHDFTKDLASTEVSHSGDACLQMTFVHKPPLKNQGDSCLEGSPMGTVKDLLPFFNQGMEENKQNESFQNMESINFVEDTLGVPTHFQNDGSALYLLTHAFSPPSSDSVCLWLFQETQKSCSNGDSGEFKNVQAAGEDPCSCYGEKMPGAQQDISGDSCNNSLSRHKEALLLVPDLPVPKSRSENAITKPVLVDTASTESRLSGVHIKENKPLDGSHDFSQISAADEKHKLTHLSQIGFRDPANTGGGQQLTIMSLEVLTESRGDLRPDPQFDAINVVSLAVEDDTSSTVEVHVLICGNNDKSSRRNMDGVSACSVNIFPEERDLLNHLIVTICSIDPDILIGWEIQLGSLGFLAERAAHLGIGLLKRISRTPPYELKQAAKNPVKDESGEILPEASSDIIQDDWGQTHASGIHVGGRIVLNLWRLMRAEVKLNIYTLETVADEVLRRKVPSIPCKVLNRWFATGPGRGRHRCIEYLNSRTNLNLEIVNQLDMINRTSELARVFGIDFFSVLSRGSQFRVESMLLRLAHSQNYLAISPGNHQVANQPAMECLPLVMEPESGFYSDPVVILDFQSLYPSMIIAYNLCYCTCLGKVFPSKSDVLGVSSYSADPHTIVDLKNQLLLTPNGVLYVQPKVRKGVLPRLLEEILSTRIMVKQAMKKLAPSQQVLQRIFNARQLALKLIANVTYGYTAAGFSGRMPCAELADSIVQCGRRTLETAISFVNEHPLWKARVVYGDTDSMFVLLKGRSVEEAFRIGKEIASTITAMNPDPVTLKFEKVYHPCFLLTKKRYVGYSYERADQKEPIFDAKGIETVRRDTCPAVAKILERSIRIMFEDQDLAKVRSYLERQWTRILSGKVSIQDFIFAKEVRLGTYSARASSLPPAAIVAMKAMASDRRAEPRYAERIPYIVVHGEPGARLIDMVINPYGLLEVGSPYRLNDLYYINKQIIPALQRVFGLLGADLNQWFREMPRPARPTLAKRHSSITHGAFYHGSDYNRLGLHKKAQSKGSRIDTYYMSRHCTVCGDLVQGSDSLCNSCLRKEEVVAAVVVGRTSKLERESQHLAAICNHCGGADWIVESGVKCISLACPVFYERRKVQRESRVLSESAGEAGYYPFCTAELF